MRSCPPARFLFLAMRLPVLLGRSGPLSTGGDVIDGVMVTPPGGGGGGCGGPKVRCGGCASPVVGAGGPNFQTTSGVIVADSIQVGGGANSPFIRV
jgi:hypothetical protein